MAKSMTSVLRSNFLGNSPDWYKATIVGFLVINPFIVMLDPFQGKVVMLGPLLVTIVMLGPLLVAIFMLG